MKKFDMEKFQERTKSDGNSKEYEYVKSDTIFKLMENKNSFYEESKKVNEKIKNVANYDKDDLHLKSTATYFYQIPIGKTLIYNEDGQIVSEINNDENYPFSVYDLTGKIKTAYGIDLNTSSKVRRVDRLFDDSFNRFIYVVNYQNEQEPVKYIVLDAQNGEILKEGIVTIVR